MEVIRARDVDKETVFLRWCRTSVYRNGFLRLLSLEIENIQHDTQALFRDEGIGVQAKSTATAATSKAIAQSMSKLNQVCRNTLRPMVS